MGTRYVVAVMKVEDVEGSESRYDTRDTTLFEVTHTDPVRLMQFAAEEVAQVLSAAAGDRTEPDPVMALVSGPRVTPKADDDGQGEASVPEKPKRTRRTRAEIEAARVVTERRLNGEPEPADGADPAPGNPVTQAPTVPAAAPVNVTAPNPWPQAAPTGTPGATEVFNPFQ